MTTPRIALTPHETLVLRMLSAACATATSVRGVDSRLLHALQEALIYLEAGQIDRAAEALTALPAKLAADREGR